MSTIKLVSNCTETNHLSILKKLFKEADEIWLATAFFKMSGLNLLLPLIKKHIKKDLDITIIAGQNFGLTEPEALKTLFTLFQSKLNANLFLDRALDKNIVFHPKLFLFKKGDVATIISGSSNITKGGLENNQEVSLMVETQIPSKEWQTAIKYFENIVDEKNATPVDMMLIKRYELFYKEQLGARMKQKVSPDEKKGGFGFDYDKLERHLKIFREENRIDFEEREEDYKRARKLLDEIVQSPRMTQSRFEEIIDSLVGAAGRSALWRSGSLFRHRFKVYRSKNEFTKLVSFIRNNQKGQTNKVFEGAKELVKVVKGASINYVTEIMMTYRPNKFANLNSNPITVLKEEAGAYFKSHSSSFNGYDYSEYCLLLKEISKKLGLKNMLYVDSFFNEIYWKIKYSEN